MSAQSRETIAFTRAVPIRHAVDVCVAGGGPAGVCAAVAAARNGASVYIIEGQACFGGLATSGLVPAFFTRFSDGVNVQAAGIGDEIYRRIAAADGYAPQVNIEDPKQRWYSLKVETLKRVYDNLVVAEKGIRFAFHTQLVGVETEGDRVAAAVCWGKSGLFAVRAKVFVDCTGDGDLAAWAGAPFKKGGAKGVLMPPTPCAVWAGTDWKKYAAARVRMSDRVKEAARAGVFEVYDEYIGASPFLPGMSLSNMLHLFGVDGTDERSLTEGWIQARRRLPQCREFFRRYVPGFESAELVATGAILGVRETRRIMGDYVLSLDDYKAQAVFDDEIGRYSYPIDIHVAAETEAEREEFRRLYVQMRYKDGESYGIPFRCLVPRKLNNVLVAGRCLSADRYIQGSIRLTSGCFITGQAAGVGAALAAAKDGIVRAIATNELLGRLKRMGAFLPNH